MPSSRLTLTWAFSHGGLWDTNVREVARLNTLVGGTLIQQQRCLLHAGISSHSTSPKKCAPWEETSLGLEPKAHVFAIKRHCLNIKQKILSK